MVRKATLTLDLDRDVRASSIIEELTELLQGSRYLQVIEIKVGSLVGDLHGHLIETKERS